jgi:uncharacterized SAM-binding protein YcdF (DUF218 family)
LKFRKNGSCGIKKIWDYMLMHHEIKPMDAILVLGSYDTRVADRAADLFLQGFGAYVICSGWKTSDYPKSEAEVFADILMAEGVPRDKIILETEARNTGENMSLTKKLLEAKNLHFNTFLLVQKPYMERRTYATFKKQWPGPECIVTSPLLTYEEYMKDEDFKKRSIKSMVGDLVRIKEYPKLGFQIEQEIPDEVWRAGEELERLGYDARILK